MQDKTIYTSVDLVKLIMAILVIGIHTEPFGFNFWLDKGFGMITRLCVPFFFVSCAYFCWNQNRAISAVKRMGILYIIWSIIYLPYDITILKEYTPTQILRLYFWDGNSHALWFLCGSIIGIAIVCILLKYLDYKAVFIISFLFLVIGCFKSSWSPIVYELTSIRLSDTLGCRNGLFYGFPYISMGMYMAKNNKWKEKSMSTLFIGFLASLIALLAESALLVIYFNTNSTILWISVYPLTYFFFSLICKIKMEFNSDISLFIRKISTLIYVSHGLFLILFSKAHYLTYFILVTICTIILSVIIILLSQKKGFRYLKYLY